MKFVACWLPARCRSKFWSYLSITQYILPKSNSYFHFLYCKSNFTQIQYVSVQQRAQFHHVQTKRAYVNMIHTLNFQHAGPTSLTQMCVYSPRLRDSAANSLRLESETFCSNANIYHISRLIRPHFFPLKNAPKYHPGQLPLRKCVVTAPDSKTLQRTHYA